MKRKKTLLFAAAAMCVAIIASCSSEPDLVAPNPGFGIVVLGIDSNGLDHKLPGARMTGHLARLPSPPFSGVPIVPAGATGNKKEFDVTLNAKSKAIVPDGVSPAAWQFKCESGCDYPDIPLSPFSPPRIASCTGKSGIFASKTGEFNMLECVPQRGLIGPLSHSSIDVSGPAVEVQVAGEGVSAAYGMPALQFFDMYGTYVAQTSASAVDTEYGLWAKGWTGCLAGLPTGTYSVQVVNATGEVVGGGHTYLYGASSANYIDDHSFFVAQQYRDFLGREPDQSGLNFWTGTITQCIDPSYRQQGETYAQCVVRKRVNVALAFWASTEFQQLHPEVVNPSGGYDNYHFVRLCHLLYLQREASQADMDFWTGNLIDLNNDYYPVVKAFINSDEYRLRFEPPPQPVCDPSWQEVSSCQQQGGSWDYAGCWCNYGGPWY